MNCRVLGTLVVLLVLAGCASRPEPTIAAKVANLGIGPQEAVRSVPGAPRPEVTPRMIAAAQPLQCVPYARQLTGLEIRGDAWTWWKTAAGRFERNNDPAVGSILVLRKTSRLRYGHLSVVTEIVSDRVVLVEHANWLNQGRIHKDIPVHDVSPNNDWSAVRVWYVPGQTLGRRTYPAHGFIHPQRQIAEVF